MNKMKRASIYFVSALAFVFAALASPASLHAHPRKERVDLLVAGGTVVTMDSSKRVIEDGAVAIRKDEIIAVGKREELANRYEATRTIDAHRRIIMPGLINAHAHAAMSLFRGI